MLLRLKVLGEFEVSDKSGLPVTILAKKNRALLAMLALAPSCTMRRERIATLLGATATRHRLAAAFARRWSPCARYLPVPDLKPSVLGGTGQARPFQS